MLALARDPQLTRCRAAHGARVRLGPAGQPQPLHAVGSSGASRLGGQSGAVAEAYVGSASAASSGGPAVGSEAAASLAAGVYPPCDAAPMQGMVLLAAPLCYLYGQPHAVYRMFKAMYCRWVGREGPPRENPSQPMTARQALKLPASDWSMVGENQQATKQPPRAAPLLVLHPAGTGASCCR